MGKRRKPKRKQPGSHGEQQPSDEERQSVVDTENQSKSAPPWRGVEFTNLNDLESFHSSGFVQLEVWLCVYGCSCFMFFFFFGVLGCWC